MGIVATRDKPVKRQASDNAVKYNRSEMYTGAALDFNGSSDNINIGDTSQDCKTLICWVYPDTDTEKIIDLDGGTHVLEISSGVVTATGFSNATIYVDGYSNTGIETGVWSMIAVTTPTAIDMNALNIGKESTNYFEGGISNVMVFNKLLSANQIESIWQDPGRPITRGLTATDLVLWLPLVEDNTTVDFALDYSGNNNHTAVTNTALLTAINKPVIQTATIGSSKKLYFDGTDDYQDLGTTASKTTLSISVWVLTSTFGKRVLTLGESSLELATSTTVEWHTTTSNSVTFTIDDYSNKLTHLLITQIGTEVKLYVNGVLDETLTATGVSAVGAASYIGRNGSDYYTGLIDELGIWSEVLTAAAVTQIYNNGLPLNLLSDSGDYINSDTLANYWRNEGAIDWTDLGTGGIDGTATGSPEEITVLTGKTTGRDGLGFLLQHNKGYATFYGNDYLEANYNSSFSLSSDITIEAWVNPTNLDNNIAIVEKEDSFYLGVTTSGEVNFSFLQTLVRELKTATSTIAANTWTHIAATYDGTTRNIYINGVLSKTDGTVTGNFDDNTNNVTTAKSVGITANNFVGNIDELRIYSEALTAGDVLTNYRTETTNHTN